MKQISATFNSNQLNAQINKTVLQIEELLAFSAKLHGKVLDSKPSILRNERPKALNDLMQYSEDLIVERNIILNDIEVACEQITTRLQAVEEANANFTIPKLAPIIEKKL